MSIIFTVKFLHFSYDKKRSVYDHSEVTISTGSEVRHEIWLLDDNVDLVTLFADCLKEKIPCYTTVFLSHSELTSALVEVVSKKRPAPSVITLDIFLDDMGSTVFDAPKLLMMLNLVPSQKIILSGGLREEDEKNLTIVSDSLAAPEHKPDNLIVYDVVLKSLTSNVISQKILGAALFYRKLFLERSLGVLTGNTLKTQMGEVTFTTTEAKCIKACFDSGSTSLERSVLGQAIWGDSKVGENALDSLLSRLRIKLKAVGLGIETTGGLCSIYAKNQIGF